MKISERIKLIKYSGTIVMSKKASTIEHQVGRVYHFDDGYPQFDASDACPEG